MNVTHFKKFRINNTENFVDVSVCEKTHSNDGFMLTAYDFTSKIEIRRKGRETAMFVSRYDDLAIPDYWKDAEIIFTNKEV